MCVPLRTITEVIHSDAVEETEEKPQVLEMKVIENEIEEITNKPKVVDSNDSKNNARKLGVDIEEVREEKPASVAEVESPKASQGK